MTLASPITARNRGVALVCLAVVAAMVGLSYAAVPLYRLFCEVTGFGGTTQRAEAATGPILDRTIKVRFDANVAAGLAWDFRPVEREVTVRIGEQELAFYRATNRSDRPLTGTAGFNVTPPLAGAYFAKIECFCFTEQTLKPGESAELPVAFFVDPEIAADPDLKTLGTITLSYTFYPAVKADRTTALAPDANDDTTAPAQATQ